MQQQADENNMSRAPGFLRKYLEMPNDSQTKTFFVAIALCLVCSIVVSAAAVMLKPVQIANKVLDRKSNILAVAGLTDPSKSVDQRFEQIEARVVEVRTGEYVEGVDPVSYDQRKAARDPEQNIVLSKDEDLAQIGSQAKLATVYLVKEGEAVKTIILPIHGYGLWSTLYGFIALEGDGSTVAGLSFYEHAETPGLGGEVDNPKWKALWPGKKVFDESGTLQIALAKGSVDPNSAKAEHLVDGLAGATLTANGVSNLVRYWLGPNGFGPYLKQFQAAGGQS